ncbi:MAG TPA: hypothetical protein VMC79_15845 [Rectinemataceae bacterium]|nr:hypothetical protein [Rectinemataceae bacterium]
MRKIVVTVVVLFALFTLIRDLPSNAGSTGIIHNTASVRSALIP